MSLDTCEFNYGSLKVHVVRLLDDDLLDPLDINVFSKILFAQHKSEGYTLTIQRSAATLSTRRRLFDLSMRIDFGRG